MKVARAALVALPVVVLFVDGKAGAADDRAVCVSAFEDAQRFRSSQRLLAAREALSVCSRPVCPKVIGEKCQKWQQSVDAALPTITLSITDDAGKPTTGARVTVDDRAMTVPDDGVLTLDPGPHGVRVMVPRFNAGEARFELKPGEKLRVVSVRLSRDGSADPVASASSSSPPPLPPSRSIPTVSYVLGGVGLVAVGVFAYLGLKGRHDENQLSNTCSPGCAPDDVSSVRTKYIAADVALGLGVVSLGVAAWFALSSKDESVSVGLGPGSALVRGKF